MAFWSVVFSPRQSFSHLSIRSKDRCVEEHYAGVEMSVVVDDSFVLSRWGVGDAKIEA